MAPDLPELRCIGMLGSGGFADVFLYERERPRIRVAVKVLRDPQLDTAVRRQFATEAELMAELSEHPFIVPVLGAGETADGRPYLVMKFYPFADLAVRTRREPMAVPDALRFAIQLLSALETAHRAGIIHRDVKPGNILLTTYGAPGLCDFGTAGRRQTSEEDVGVSLPWAAPEVLSGRDDGSSVSDVYALAATLWTLLVGRPPFDVPGGDNSPGGIYDRVLHAAPPPTGRSDVPESLDRVLITAMAKDPGQRPRSALLLAEQLRDVERALGLVPTDVVLLDRAASVRSGAATPPDPVPTVRRHTTRIGAQHPVGTAASAVSAPQDDFAASDDGRRWSTVSLALAVLTGLVVIGALTLWLHAEDPAPRVLATAPPATDLPGVDTGPPAPAAVNGRVQGGRVIFSWSPVAGAEAYQWTSHAGRAGRLGRPRLVLPYDGSRVCVTVRTLADGTGSQGATRGCAG